MLSAPCSGPRRAGRCGTSDDPTRIVPSAQRGAGRRLARARRRRGGADERVGVAPPGYDAARGKRYPVLYMHDGQNLFDRRADQVRPGMGHRRSRAADGAAGRPAPVDRGRRAKPASTVPDAVSGRRCCPCCRRRCASGSMTLDDGNAKGAFASDAYLRFLTGTVKRARRRHLPHACRARRHGGDGQLDGRADGLLRHDRTSVGVRAGGGGVDARRARRLDRQGDRSCRAAREVAEAFRRYLATARVRPGDQPAVYRPWVGRRSTAAMGPIRRRCCRCFAGAGWRGAASSSAPMPGPSIMKRHGRSGSTSRSPSSTAHDP